MNKTAIIKQSITEFFLVVTDSNFRILIMTHVERMGEVGAGRDYFQRGVSNNIICLKGSTALSPLIIFLKLQSKVFKVKAKF